MIHIRAQAFEHSRHAKRLVDLERKINKCIIRYSIIKLLARSKKHILIGKPKQVFKKIKIGIEAMSCKYKIQV